MSLLNVIAPAALTAEEERNLIEVVRATEFVTVFDNDAEAEVRRYFPTRDQEKALQALIAAYVLDITRAATQKKAVQILGQDEAEGVAVEKFIQIARDQNRTNERLAGFVSKAMANAVMQATTEASSVIRIPSETLRRYFRLVEKHGSASAAYAACKVESNGMEATAFLAINSALNSDSIDKIQVTGNGDSISAEPSSTLLTAVGHEVTPEEKVVADDLVRWLFAQVSDLEEQVLRLAYGFTDTRSENQRVRNGYQWDALLSDMQISPVVGLGRQKVQRTRTTALASMRDALNSLVNDGV